MVAGIELPSHEGSSSERNSKLLRAVLNISSVIEEPLELRGELSSASFAF
jgi:hypothetical protein